MAGDEALLPSKRAKRARKPLKKARDTYLYKTLHSNPNSTLILQSAGPKEKKMTAVGGCGCTSIRPSGLGLCRVVPGADMACSGAAGEAAHQLAP